MKRLILYFVLTYAITWLIWLPYYAGISSNPIFHLLGAYGPITAALIIAFRERGFKGCKVFLASIFHFPKKIFYFMVALLAPFILLVVAVLMNYFINNTALSFEGLGRWKEINSLSTIAYFAVSFFVFGIGEEAGWRSIAIPELQKRFNALNTSIIFTFFWALWHWPLFFYEHSGYYNMNFAAIIAWFFSLLVGSIILTWLFNASGGSILACAIFHATIDIVFISDIPDKNIPNYIGLLTALWAVVIIIKYRAKNLAKTERVKSVAIVSFN
jgi:membrane protease YdiL (CAAX protease family)